MTMFNRKAFVTSYNHFDIRPLVGQTLHDFYVDDFCKTSVEEIVTTVQISEQYRKMLLIGHRGCGKSTILNKVAEELDDQYYVVSFSASEELNMMDVETVDILLVAYLQLLKSVDENWLISLFKEDETFKEFIDLLNKPLKLKTNDIGSELFKTMGFEFKVEKESRAEIRSQLHGQTKKLLENICKVCKKVEQQQNKTILIIIDTLDKLKTEFAEKIFFENQFLLTLPEVKIIYTFPLDTYYSTGYISDGDRYEELLIPLVNLKNREGNKITANMTALSKLIDCRIDFNLVKPEAWDYLITMSGGLLRDLVKYMRAACKLAILEKKEVIDLEIAQQVVSKYINDYYRVFDMAEHQLEIEELATTKGKKGNKKLVYFLQYLFALEYRQDKQLWYDIHPCLKEALKRGSHD
jgi:ABC-type dipeptide/oligopeptide/nickel transport system ATPase component